MTNFLLRQIEKKICVGTAETVWAMTETTGNLYWIWLWKTGLFPVLDPLLLPVRILFTDNTPAQWFRDINEPV